MPAPVFVHSNWRTGGTALMAALRRDEACRIFFDPFNLTLSLPWSQIQHLDATTWPSGHPADMGGYFAEYAPLVEYDHVRGAREAYAWSYVMKADDEDQQQQYIASLVDLASSRDQLVVLKFEQTEGRVAWLRRHFPDAIHVGLLRDGDAQFRSWMTLLVVHNNAGFFESGHRLAKDNPAFFGAAHVADSIDLADWDELRSLFDVFYAATTRVRLEAMDVTLDLSPESRESVDDQAQALQGLPAHVIRALLDALRATRASVPPKSGPTLAELRLMHDVVMPVRMENTDLVARCTQLRSQLAVTTAERVSVLALRDEMASALRDAEDGLSGTRAALAAAEEDAAVARASFSEVTSSTSWRLTSPLRWMSRWARSS